MQDGFLILIRVVFTTLFLVTLFVGAYLLKNDRRLFGRDPQLPSEGVSARAYSRLQVYAIWTHVFFLTGSFALLIH